MTQHRIDGAQGTVLGGRYRLGPLLGRGGMASVYEARDEALDRPVAIKLFRTDISDPDELTRQEEEARLLARLNHPNLVTVFDAGTDTALHEPQTFLVMELVRGTDLRRALHLAQLPGDEVARVGAGVAEALDYIHRSGVIHRDVKPANIMLNNEGDDGGARRRANPKLTDFGIARLVDGARLTATGESLGTAMYFSPEQAAGAAIGPASDIYSLGLVLLECLTGTTAFPGPAVASAAARLHRDPHVPETIGADWRQLLIDMTSRDPAERPMARNVAEILRGLRSGSSIGSTASMHHSAEVRDGAGGRGAASAPTVAVDVPTQQQPLLEPQSSPGPATDAQRSSEAGPRRRRHAGPSTVRRDAVPPTMAERKVPVRPAGRPALELPDDTDGPANRRPSTARAGSNTRSDTGSPAGSPQDQSTGRQLAGRRASRRRRMLLTVVGAIIVAGVAVILILASLGSGTEPAPQPYPSVPGELGSHLEQLQESVEP